MEPTCVHCGSDKEPYFSRSEPMGDYCSECGHNFYERGTSETDRTERRWRDYLLLNVDDIFDFARRLERERDEAIEECAKWHGMAIEADKRFVESVLVRDEESKKSRREHDLAKEAIATWQKTREERDALQEQLDAAIMLGKMQERRHERELEELIAAAKAVIDRWETPFWKEAAHTGAYITALRKAVEIAEGGHL